MSIFLQGWPEERTSGYSSDSKWEGIPPTATEHDMYSAEGRESCHPFYCDFIILFFKMCRLELSNYLNTRFICLSLVKAKQMLKDIHCFRRHCWVGSVLCMNPRCFPGTAQEQKCWSMVSHIVTSNNGCREHMEPAGCWSVAWEPVDSEPVARLGQLRATLFFHPLPYSSLEEEPLL